MGSGDRREAPEMARSVMQRPASERPPMPASGGRAIQRRPGILMLSSHFPPAVGGSEIQAFQLGRELVRLGFPVSVLTQPHPGCPASESLSGVRVLRVVVGRARGPVYPLTYLGSLLRHIAAQRKAHGILHAHHLYLEAMAVAAFRTCQKMPSLAKVACGGPFGDFARLQRTGADLALPLLRRLDRVVALSQKIRHELISVGFVAGKIAQIPNGTDATRFAPVPDPAAAQSAAGFGVETVLFLGRLDSQKGLVVALSAWVSWPGDGRGPSSSWRGRAHRCRR